MPQFETTYSPVSPLPQQIKAHFAQHAIFLLLLAGLLTSCSREPLTSTIGEKNPTPLRSENSTGADPEQGPEHGHTAGNGSDLLRPENGTAWFADPQRKIPACLEVAKDFGWEASELRSLVTKSWQDWSAYQDSKHLRYEAPDGSKRSLFPREIVWVDDCTKAQLRLLFGVANARVEAELASGPERLALAVPTEYDANELWGAGSIWFAAPKSIDKRSDFPNWRLPGCLKAILMHELGHVLGCGHVAGTIMDAKLGEFLRDRAVLSQNTNWKSEVSAFTQIDQQRELYFCRTCDTQYVGQLPPRHIFEALVGRLPQEPGHASVELIHRGDGVELANWKLHDALGDYTFTLNVSKDGATYIPSSVPIFKVALKNPHQADPVIIQANGGDAWLYWANLIVPSSGTTLSVQLQINASAQPDSAPDAVEVSHSIESSYWPQTMPLQIRGPGQTFGGFTLFKGSHPAHSAD